MEHEVAACWRKHKPQVAVVDNQRTWAGHGFPANKLQRQTLPKATGWKPPREQLVFVDFRRSNDRGEVVAQELSRLTAQLQWDDGRTHFRAP